MNPDRSKQNEFAHARLQGLRAAIERYPHEADAILFAFDAHRDQQYGDAPYILHLHDVRDVLASHPSVPEPTKLAAWLHDVIEDCEVEPVTGEYDTYYPTTYASEILKRFGKDVFRLVETVTATGGNHKTRAAHTVAALRQHPEAVSLKLADRIANIEACIRDKSPKLEMYRKEQPLFDSLRLIGDDAARALWPRLDAAWASAPAPEPSICRVHDADDPIPGRICGRQLPCKDHTPR